MTVTINGNGAISGLSITTTDLADSSVTTAKIATGAVATVDIAANAVTAAKLAREGTTGQVLTSNGAGADPSYQTISTTPTTAQVLAATAGATAGAVGTYATANMSPSGTIVVGATTAGSNLRGVNSSGSIYSPGFSGTWRNMGSSQYEPAGYTAATPVFLRIS